MERPEAPPKPTTKQRRFGEEQPFCSWLRRQRGLDSVNASIVASDVDYTLLKYKVSVNGEATRKAQLMMMIELKTCNAELDHCQWDILFFLHQLLCKTRRLTHRTRGKVLVKHFGCFVLALPWNEPRDGDQMWWGAFTPEGGIHWNLIQEENTLVEILSFTRNPGHISAPLFQEEA